MNRKKILIKQVTMDKKNIYLQAALEIFSKKDGIYLICRVIEKLCLLKRGQAPYDLYELNKILAERFPEIYLFKDPREDSIIWFSEQLENQFGIESEEEVNDIKSWACLLMAQLPETE